MLESDFLTVLRQHWENAALENAFWADDDLPPGLATLHSRTTIRTEGNVRRGIGRSREQCRGVVMAEVFSPKAEGEGLGERYAANIAQIWRVFRHQRIQLDAPSVIGLTADGAFNRHLVTLGWRGDMRFEA